MKQTKRWVSVVMLVVVGACSPTSITVDRAGDTRGSMGHQHRYIHIPEDVTRDPAKDHLAQA
jgi:hypothetical protein